MVKSIDIAPIFQCLWGPERYKVFYGGRGGGKSWNISRFLTFTAARSRTRVLCGRETQSSIAESVHKLLRDTIADLKLPGYRVGMKKIINANGSEFVFEGIKDNPSKLKGYEDVDYCWLEEAWNISEESWEIIRPTIRKPGSKIIISFNPVLATDATYSQFVLNPPADCKVVKVSWTDNPWFNETLDAERRELKAKSIKSYRHVWGGECRAAVEGAIFESEMSAADAEHRICAVPYDRTKPVETVWDLGHTDLNAIWFVQAYGGWFNFIDYVQGNGRTIADWLVCLQQRGYVYGTDWLPWDGVDALLHKKLTSSADMSPEMLLRNAGRKVRIVQKLEIHSRINAARTFLPQCRFDRDKCQHGLEALRMYQWEPAHKVTTSAGAVIKTEPKRPLHDKYSHGSDAFTEAAVCIKQPTNTPAPRVAENPRRKPAPFM